MRNFLRFAGELLFPPRCVACGKRVGVTYGMEAPYFCEACAEEWQREQVLQCPDCFCEYYRCRCQPKILEKAGSLAYLKLVPYGTGERYRAAHQLVHHMKHQPRARLFRAAAADLAPLVRLAVRELALEQERLVLCALPRSRHGLRENGFDHAALLAKAISAEVGIPCRPLLRAVRERDEQKKMTGKTARAANVKGAFAACGEVSGLSVILVDDIVTSGAGMAEAVRVLRKAGATEVLALSVAYTESREKRKLS